MREGRIRGQARQKLALDLFNHMLLRPLPENRAENARVLRPRDGDRCVQRFWQQPFRRAGIPQSARGMTDKLGKLRLIAIKRALHNAQIGPPLGEARLRLRQVSFGDLADLEAIFRRAKLFRQNSHIVLAQLHLRLIADDVHIRRCSVQEDVLLGRAKILAPSLDTCLRSLDVVVGSETVEDILLSGYLGCGGVVRIPCVPPPPPKLLSGVLRALSPGASAQVPLGFTAPGQIGMEPGADYATPRVVARKSSKPY